MAAVFDVCVIGAGVVGSSTAYSLSKQGVKVLLIEQFPIPHTRGSSHGQTRITRCCYSTEVYSKMSFNAMEIWRSLEKAVDEELFINNGMLEIFESQSEHFNQCCKVLDSINVNYDILTAEEILSKFPVFNLENNCFGLYETKGGMLMATKCVLALQKMFTHNGGVIHENEEVTSITPGSFVTVTTSKGQYSAKSIVITAGAFTSKLTKTLGLDLPLKVERTHACYWNVEVPTLVSARNGFPSFIAPNKIYGLASLEYPGKIKICSHFGKEIDPQRPDVLEPDHSSVIKFVKGHTKGVSIKPTVVEPCLYTVTPDRNFILDTHPIYDNIVIGAGFSGHGFKMAPVTGNILADLALGKEPSYDMSLFKIKRFKNVLYSNL